jgi:hypothetical protein
LATRATRSSAPTTSAPALRASVGLLAGGEHGHSDVAARTRREGQRATDDLIGLAGVNPEPEGQLDGLVELGLGQLLDHVDSLGDAVLLLAVDLAERLGVLLSVLGHVGFLRFVLVSPVSPRR